MDNARSILKKIDTFLSQNQLNIVNKDLIFKQCFNEAWFSNTLAWLLDPKGSHGLGVSFSNEFLKTLAKLRTQDSVKYARKKSLLKWGKGGSGTSSTGFSLKNASVIREFYLAKSISKNSIRGPRYCDIALIDLDSSDSIFLVIENKLFYSNYPSQLDEYYDAVEEKFRRAKVREYVYLTIHGSDPIQYTGETKHKYWVRMSWNQDILSIISKVHNQNEHKEIIKLRHLLEWLRNLNQPSIKKPIEELRRLLLKIASSCLHAELKRLGEGKTGSWEIKNPEGKNITINHTSYPKTPLFVELLPNLSITVQSRRKGKPLFEKIIVPYGANTDQIFNLLDIAARDIYHHCFSDKKDRYLADKRRLTSILTKEKEEIKYIFDYVSRNQNELKNLFTISKHIWQAQKYELQESQLASKPLI